MPELEEQLRRYATAAERSVAPAGRRAEARRTVRRRGPWLALAGAAALVAAVAFTLSDDDAEVSTEPSTAPTSTATVTPHSSSTTIAGTSSHRFAPVVVSIECPAGARCVRTEELLVWAGEAGSEAAVRADGFRVALASGEVRPVPVAPIAPRSGATGVWTGTELVVCCGATGVDNGTAAAWNPDTGGWRVLADPPSRVTDSYADSVWTGDQMVVVAPGGAATYDPATDRWQEIPSPTGGTRPEAIWTGNAVVVWDGGYDDGVFPATDDEADRGWTWRPGEERWTRLPPLPAGHRTTFGSMVWTGREVVVWGKSTSDDARGVGARWRPGEGAWLPMAAHPSGPVELPYEGTSGSQTLAATDDGRVLVKDLDGSHLSDRLDLYDPRSDTWLPLDLTIGGYHPSITIAGDLVLVPDEARPIAGRLPG